MAKNGFHNFSYRVHLEQLRKIEKKIQSRTRFETHGTDKRFCLVCYMDTSMCMCLDEKYFFWASKRENECE